MIFHFVFVARTDNRTNSTTVPDTFPRITYYEHYRQTDALMIKRIHIRGYRLLHRERKPCKTNLMSLELLERFCPPRSPNKFQKFLKISR